MANCPKCGHHLKMTDWRPNCPNCGVNLVYYGMEERLQEEADVAEVEHVHAQQKIDRLKASFVGSPLAGIRLAFSILPIAALMLPLCAVTYSGPFIEQTTDKINAISIYNLVSSVDFGQLFTMMNSKIVGSGFTGYAVSLICILVSVVMILVSLFALTCANGKHGNSRNIINDCIMVGSAIASIVFFNRFASDIAKVFPDYFSGKLEIGAYVYFASTALLLAINIIIAVKKPAVKYKQCYVGGIPYEKYTQMVADGVPVDDIHAEMDKILAEKEAVRMAELAKKEAERKAKEDAELEAKASKYSKRAQALKSGKNEKTDGVSDNDKDDGVDDKKE